ncbi:transposase [Streptomyces kronopolitis]|uniref:transposase n=1 Tax=Streptomyces kronopolitis TaxID=1612435 RepID=UPI003F4E3B49
MSSCCRDPGELQAPPHPHRCTQWHRWHSQQGLPVIRVRFNPADCRDCPHLRACVNSPKAEYRSLNLRHRDEYEVVQAARTEQRTDAWKDRYKIRAGVEGTISQGVQRCGLRRSRYRGLAKTSLQHQFTAPRSTSHASTPASPAHPGPAPAPATSQLFAPPTKRSTGRSRRP